MLKQKPRKGETSTLLLGAVRGIEDRRRKNLFAVLKPPVIEKKKTAATVELGVFKATGSYNLGEEREIHRDQRKNRPPIERPPKTRLKGN